MQAKVIGTASEVANDLDGLMECLNRKHNALADECRRAAVQWAELKRLAGERDDHAAALLKNVHRCLEGLARTAAVCAEQVALAIG